MFATPFLSFLSLALFQAAALVGAQSCDSTGSTGMPIVQNSHRIAINSSVNGVSFSFATYVAPNYYADSTFKPKQGHVWIHGQGRGGDEMVNAYKNSLPKAVSAGLVAERDVVVLSIVLPHQEDEAKSLFPGVLTWCANEWMEGGDARSAQVSSFNVLRSSFDWLAQTYPSITTFVIGGHSAGAQLVQRWAVTNPTDPVPHRYIIANPSSVAYFTSERPNCNVTSSCSCIAPGYESQCCSDFNDWKNGLNNYPHRFQNAAMNAANKQSIIDRYISRRIHYLYGGNDNEGTANGCGPNAQGLGHYDRGQKWWSYLTRNWPRVTSTQTQDNVAGIGHDSSGIWSSTQGLKRVYGS
ncbi:hypothetical protein EXIGLDRAFT_763791 [Exidia glandulosa HHB12029]|uniref:Alpha/beta-hydrolase n=1 Tax=Exidia glandulosa HHB12029 TaxID=1314781 RepID=A0A165LNV6_EXIGL|nr:hypothetical protein EXIGLDRAFT_763791 [Exidia glandulosa HHB12029]